MTKKNLHIIIFSLLTIVVYALWRYFVFQQEIFKDKPFTKGYSVENIVLRIIDEKGEISAKFESPSLIRYIDNPTIIIQAPKFWAYTTGIESWLITSNTAKYNTETDEVLLEDNLVAQNMNNKNPTKFEAQNLLVNLNTKLASTNDGINLQQQQLNLQGQIAKFDLNNEIIEVNNNVKAIYKAIQ